MNICGFYYSCTILKLLNDLSSATLVGMGQQLAAISAGFKDLPTSIARALPGAGTTPSAAPNLSSSTVVARVKPLPQLDRSNHKNVVHWDREMYKRL